MGSALIGVNASHRLENTFLHAGVAEISGCGSAVPIIHSEVQDLICQLGEVESIFILFPFANVRGAAHVFQADFGDRLAILNAGGQ